MLRRIAPADAWRAAAEERRPRRGRPAARRLESSLPAVVRAASSHADAPSSPAYAPAPSETCPMSLKCGIVGLPNVGKSTLFNALTKAGIAAENYPFCTIEPNVGIVELPDARLQALAAIVEAGTDRPGDRRVRRHRRARRRGVEGRRSRQPVPRAHPRDRRDRQRRALLRRRERHPRRQQDRPGLRRRGDPDRALPGRHGDRREEPGALHEGRRNPATTRRRSGWSTCSPSAWRR